MTIDGWEQVGWRIRANGALFRSGTDDETDAVFEDDPESYEPVFVQRPPG